LFASGDSRPDITGALNRRDISTILKVAELLESELNLCFAGQDLRASNGMAVIASWTVGRSQMGL
jgi:hypothetical protein